MAVDDARHILLHRIDASICVYSNGWCAVGISLHFISLRQVRAFKEAFITYNVCSSSLMLLWWKRCAASLRNLLARNASFHEDVTRSRRKIIAICDWSIELPGPTVNRNLSFAVMLPDSRINVAISSCRLLSHSIVPDTCRSPFPSYCATRPSLTSVFRRIHRPANTLMAYIGREYSRSISFPKNSLWQITFHYTKRTKKRGVEGIAMNRFVKSALEREKNEKGDDSVTSRQKLMRG